MSALGYSQLRNDLLRDNPLKPGPRLLYTVLASYAWKAPKVRISTTRLSKDLNLSQRTIRRYLRHLEAQGYIKTIYLTGYVNEYQLLVPYHPGQVRRLSPADQWPSASGQVARQPKNDPPKRHSPGSERQVAGIINGSTHRLARR